jgi:hypothetical protein
MRWITALRIRRNSKEKPCTEYHGRMVLGAIRRVMEDKWQIGMLMVLALILAGMASILPATGSDTFERFLGPIHPALALALATVLAVPSMRFLIRRFGFSSHAWRQTRSGLTVAVGAAAIFGVSVIVADLGLRYPETINVAFPQSLLFYPPIGLFVDLAFHSALPALLLLVQLPIVRWLGEKRVVWVAILLAALVEPLLQVLWAGSLSWTEVYTAVSVFLFGVTQLLIFRKHGFLAMYGMRLTFYLFWHIIWGHFRLVLLF